MVAYERIKPHRDAVAELQLARVAWLIAESNRDSKRRSRPFDLNDFLVSTARRKRVDDEVDSMFLWCAAMAGVTTCPPLPSSAPS